MTKPIFQHEYTNSIAVRPATYLIPAVTSEEMNGQVTCIVSSPENLVPEVTATATVRREYASYHPS